MVNEGLGWGFPILKMVHNPGGDCCWEGGGTTQTIDDLFVDVSPVFEGVSSGS